MKSNDLRVNALVGTGHFMSHFYQLCLPPLFVVWQSEFHVGFAELGLSTALMMGTAAILQTPAGFLVDRYGARPFLIGGAFLMSIGICSMALATSYWQLVLLSFISGVGNAVFHPCDYAILAGSIRTDRIGRSFAFHSFSGNAGFAAAPPAITLLLACMSWRNTLLAVGAVGLLVVALLVLQSSVLHEQSNTARARVKLTFAGLLFDRTLALFFMFYLLGAMASGGIQAWAITILHQFKGLTLAAAAGALAAYMIGNSVGVFLGGYVADRGTRYLGSFVAASTALSAAAIVTLNVMPAGGVWAAGLLLASGTALGASRTPRDVMLKEVSPPGQLGKVFGFVSAGLPLGSALTPVPFGYLIDHGWASAVFVLAACFLLASIACMGTARVSHEVMAPVQP